MAPLTRRTAQASSLALLALLALAPLALTRCGGPREPAPSPPASASSSASWGTDVPPSSASSVVTAEAPPDSATETPPAPPASTEKPFTGPIPKDCAALDAAINKAFADRACKKDSECGGASRYCSCEGAVAQRQVSKINALNAEFSKKECYRKGPPRPCATCAPPKPHVCANGSCT